MRNRVRIALLACGCPLLAFAQSADLIVAKVAPGTAPAGANVAYTLTVLNAGPDPAADITLDDPLPAGTTFVSLVQNSGPAFTCSVPAAGASGTVSCSAPAFAVAATAVFTLTAKIDDGATPGAVITNIATVASPVDFTEENNTAAAATVIPGPTADAGVLQSAPVSAAPNSNIVYAVTLFNAGPDAASGVSLTDVLPGDLTFVSLSAPAGLSCTTPAVGSGGMIICSTASLPPGFSGTLTLTAHVPSGTPTGARYDNIVAVLSPFDPNPENDLAVASTTVSVADISITVTAAGSAAVGTNLSYTVTMANNGPDTASGAAWTDALPAGMTFVSLAQNTGPAFICSNPGVGAGGSAGCANFAPLASGASAQFTLVVAVGLSAAGSTVSNSFAASSESFDPNAANNTATAATSVPPVSDVSVTITPVNFAAPDTTISYSIVVTNNGPSSASNVTLTDVLPAGLTFLSLAQSGSPTFTCTQPGVGAAGGVSCSASTMAASASVTFTLVARVANSVAVGSTISNSATVGTSTTDLNSANNTSAVTTTVAAQPTSIPTLGTWGMALLGAALAAFGARAIRPAIRS